MNDRSFARRVGKELPRWEAQGWISPEGAAAIQADLERHGSAGSWPALLALCGALLLGVGLLTWVAAHWSEMSRLARLSLVFAGLFTSHLAHGHFRIKGGLPGLTEGLSLLSVLCFGASIMLIGQIYHIDAHFPNGVALWACGALLTAALLRSQPSMVAALLLAGLWSWYEQAEYRSLNWPLCLFLAVAVPLIRREEWRYAGRCWGMLLVGWMLGWHSIEALETGSGNHLRLLALQVLAWAGIWAMAQAGRDRLAQAVRPVFLLATLTGSFVLTYPDVGGSGVGDPQQQWFWWGGTLVAGVFYTLAMVRLIHGTALSKNLRSVAMALAATLGALVVLEVVWPRQGLAALLLWNLFLLAALYGMGHYGVRQSDRSLVNRAFAGFVIWLLARYFDTFWTLLDRSLFFLAGGVLLLAVGGALEHRRRRLLAAIEAEPRR